MNSNLNCSLAIRECIGLPYLALGLVLKTYLFFFFFPTNQLGATHKPMAAWSPAFSHASGNLLVFTLSLLAFVVFIFVVSGRCDNFGSGFYDTQSECILHANQIM